MEEGERDRERVGGDKGDMGREDGGGGGGEEHTEAALTTTESTPQAVASHVKRSSFQYILVPRLGSEAGLGLGLLITS